jgi:uncharacterized coiled-coil protein SlyX
MWPFDKDNYLLPQVPAPLHQPVEVSAEARIRALEQKCAQLEWSIHEICNAIAISQEVSNQNFTAIGDMFQRVVQYVMRPSKNIMGEHQDTN